MVVTRVQPERKSARMVGRCFLSMASALLCPRPCTECTKQVTKLQQKHLFLLLWGSTDLYSSLFSFSPLSHGRKLCVYLSRGFQQPWRLSLPPVSQLRPTQGISGRGTASPAGIPGQPPGTWLNSPKDPSLLRSTTCFAKAVITL